MEEKTNLTSPLIQQSSLNHVDDHFNSAEKPTQKLIKMSNCKTFFALIKSYMAINILLTPRSFVNGGYVLSPCALITATCIEQMGSIRLI